MIKVVDTEEEILKLEQLRLKAIRANKEIDSPTKTFYGNKLLSKEFLGITLEENNELLAGCIISNHIKELYIEWLFTDPDYRKQGNASKLLKFVENNIELFNEYYSQNFDKILLEPYIAVEGFYKKNGYREFGNDYMQKRIIPKKKVLN